MAKVMITHITKSAKKKKKLFLFYVEFSIFAIKLHIVCIRRIPLFNLPEYPFQEQR